MCVCVCYLYLKCDRFLSQGRLQASLLILQRLQGVKHLIQLAVAFSLNIVSFLQLFFDCGNLSLVVILKININNAA